MILAGQIALLILFVGLIISTGINFWLYLRVRRLQTELSEQHYGSKRLTVLEATAWYRRAQREKRDD